MQMWLHLELEYVGLFKIARAMATVDVDHQIRNCLARLQLYRDHQASFLRTQSTLAALAASYTSSSVASNRPYKIFSLIVALNMRFLVV